MMAIGIMGGATENRVLLGPQLHSTFAASLYFSGGLGTGAMLALAFGQDVPRLGLQAMVAAALATLALFSMSSDLPVYAASALLIVMARQRGALRDFLRSPLLVGLGAISFSLYLVHVPVLVATMHALHDDWQPEAMAAFGAVVALAAALPMYAMVEVPSRRLARWVEKRLAQRAEQRLAQRAGKRRAPQAVPHVARAASPVPDWAPEGGMPSRVA